MATWLGIDVGSTSVKVAVVRSAYRKLAIERLVSVEIAAPADATAAVRDAVSTAMAGLPPAIDAMATALEGHKAAIHRLLVPATAQRQLTDVLAYELEAQVPFDMEGAVFDWRVLDRSAVPQAEQQVAVVAAVARVDDVKARIQLVQGATNQEPERVSVGPFALGALAPYVPGLADHACVAIVDLGAKASEVLVMERGEAVFARTLSTGTDGLPATASRLARDIRVSLAGHRAQGGAAPTAIYVCGGGAFVSGAEGFLSGELETPVHLLPVPNLDASPLGESARELPRYAKAVGLALTLAGRGSGLNMRRGPLAFERGFSWVREKIPVLAGLASVIAVSFAFSAWARVYTIGKQRSVLEDALGSVTKTVLGSEVSTAQEAQDLLSKEVSLSDDDPMAHADAFDVMVRLSEVIPMSMTHDIEELDVQKSHVVVRGIVGSIPDAQSIATSLGEKPCFDGVKIKSTTQAVGTDRQKYVMEFDLRCPEDVRAGAKKKDAASGGGK
ncbi:MAG: pilus assembly protein PilM [Polyangiaceae bacterium]|nr:pilus assembly protein PilM [Polyangiaceae bacterium]